MSEYKPAKNGIFSPEEFPPTPDRIYDCAYSGRIDAWGHSTDSYMLGYIDATYTAMLAGGMDDKEATLWMSHAAGASVKGCWDKNIERSQLEGMMGDDDECDPDCPWINHETNGCDRRHREERTCHIDGGYYDELLEFQCTRLSCGHEVKGYVEYGDYCTKCGSKVVSEWADAVTLASTLSTA